MVKRVAWTRFTASIIAPSFSSLKPIKFWDTEFLMVTLPPPPSGSSISHCKIDIWRTGIGLTQCKLTLSPAFIAPRARNFRTRVIVYQPKFIKLKI